MALAAAAPNQPRGDDPIKLSPTEPRRQLQEPVRRLYDSFLIVSITSSPPDWPVLQSTPLSPYIGSLLCSTLSYELLLLGFQLEPF